MAGEQSHQTDVLLVSPFLLRLRQLLHQACATHGVETVRQALDIPKAVMHGLEAPMEETELKECRSLDLAPDTKDPVLPVEEHKEPRSVPLEFSEEEKRKAVNLFRRGVKLEYIGCLYHISNPKAILSWDDWRSRPKAEADRNLEKRKQIQRMLNHGETVKNIKAELKIKQRLYRELMGIAVRDTFTRAAYESVVAQMTAYNSLRIVSKNTNVPPYFIKKWLSGKGIPPKDVLEGDDTASVEIKRKAIEIFYETGNALAATPVVGAKHAHLVERWVLQFQKLVDEREASAT